MTDNSWVTTDDSSRLSSCSNVKKSQKRNGHSGYKSNSISQCASRSRNDQGFQQSRGGGDGRFRSQPASLEEIEQKLNDSYKFDVNEVLLKTFPHHKIISSSINEEMKDKFEFVCSRVPDYQKNSFDMLFRPDFNL